MNAVTPIDTAVNPTVENACRWISQKGARGELPASTARFKVSAIRQLTAILDDEEPRDNARWVLENVDAIAKRWATKHAGKYGAETIKTYASRAKSSLEDYLRWLEDPTSFRFTRERDPAKPKVVREGDVKAAANPKAPRVEDEGGDASEVPLSSAAKGSNVRTFPLPGGRLFQFELPAGDLSVDDVRRIGLHLWTFAHDINASAPTDPFAMVRSGE